MRLHLTVFLIVLAADSAVLDSAVHAFDLTVGPGMVGLSQPVFGFVAITDAVERVTAEPAVGPLRFFDRSANWIPLSVSTVLIWYGVDKPFKERGSGGHVGAIQQLDEGKLGRAVDGNEKMELALNGPHLGDVHMKKPIG